MEDMQARLTKLLDDASDCDLISNLATDQRKRATFRRMAGELRDVAARLRAEIATRETQLKLKEAACETSAVSAKFCA